MADAELQTFTSIMDALVRISVSTFALLKPHYTFSVIYTRLLFNTRM